MAGFGDVGAEAGSQGLAQRHQVGPRAGAWPQLDGVVRGHDACGGAAECLPAGVQGGPVRVVDLASDPGGDWPAAHGQGEPVAYVQADLGEEFGVDVHLAGGVVPVAADHRPVQPGRIAVIGHDVQVRQTAGHADRVDHRAVVRLGDVAECSRLGADGGDDLPALGGCQRLLGAALAQPGYDLPLAETGNVVDLDEGGVEADGEDHRGGAEEDDGQGGGGAGGTRERRGQADGDGAGQGQPARQPVRGVAAAAAGGLPGCDRLDGGQPPGAQGGHQRGQPGQGTHCHRYRHVDPQRDVLDTDLE